MLLYCCQFPVLCVFRSQGFVPPGRGFFRQTCREVGGRCPPGIGAFRAPSTDRFSASLSARGGRSRLPAKRVLTAVGPDEEDAILRRREDSPPGDLLFPPALAGGGGRRPPAGYFLLVQKVTKNTLRGPTSGLFPRLWRGTKAAVPLRTPVITGERHAGRLAVNGGAWKSNRRIAGDHCH